MTEILQANIFFFITSVAVILVTILIGIALFYLVSILRNVKDISDRVKRGSEILGQDLTTLRTTLKKEGTKTQNIFDALISRFIPKKKRASRKKKTDDSE